jgi:TolB-like protein/DNA-binding winged helix-turn-helix (wHTH) protein/thioredoxin-like negative regulator of GroEL
MDSEFRLGPWLVQPSLNAVSRDGKATRLEPKVMGVLVYLAVHSSETVSKEQLIRAVWGDTFVTDDVLTRSISELRKALDDDAKEPRIIQTIPRKGYRLVPRVEPVKQKTFQRYLIASLAFAVILLAALAYVRFRPHSPPIHSLAVLPLKNLSGDPSQDYLADGMTDELIGRLSSIRGLRVISRTSVMRFKDATHSVPEIAKALGVDAIVEGSVTPQGTRVRVSAQLIRASTDDHIWSQTYDREIRDVLTLQSELAQSIAHKVEVTVTGEEHQRLAATRPVAPEVYESYLQGQFAFNKSNNKAELEASIPYFEKAINKDPTFAPAYVALADAYSLLGTVFIGGRPEQTRPQVITAARKALDLDPNNAKAHALLADVLQEQWHWADAELEYKRALELNPNDAFTHSEFAMWLVCQGRTEEALAQVQRGRQLDPVAVPGSDVAWILFQSRRYDEAIRESRSALAIRPDDAGTLRIIAFPLIASNQPGDAIPPLEKAASVSNRGADVLGLLICAYAHAGRRDDALRLLAELKDRAKSGYVPPGVFVLVYVGLGNNEETFAWLERSYAEQSNILQFLKVHPFFDPLRTDPRFADLLRRVGLPA